MSGNDVTFLDLVRLDKAEIERTKIRFHQYDSYNNPLDEYVINPDIINDNWLFWKPNNKRVFHIGQVGVSFVQFTSSDTWLLTTIKTVTKEYTIYVPGTGYEGVEREDFSHLYGRLVVRFNKTGRNMDRIAAKDDFIYNLPIVELLPRPYDGEAFPGFENIRLSFSMLESIITKNKTDWIANLENQKAVYLITDTSNGKQYVGAAYGDRGMLLKRWKDYVYSGHGGNVALMKIDRKHIERYFQYSILEIYNARVDDSTIIRRENWWMGTLCTRAHGYN